MDALEQMTNLEQMYVMIDAAHRAQLNSFAHDPGSDGAKVWESDAAVKRANAQLFALASIAESLARIAAYCDYRGKNEALDGNPVTDREFYG